MNFSRLEHPTTGLGVSLSVAGAAPRPRLNPVQGVLILALYGYRFVLSPAKAALFGPLGRCRFTPSCSAYALEAIRQHGAGRGFWLALRRVGRCHPWGGCGHDPVPEANSGRSYVARQTA